MPTCQLPKIPTAREHPTIVLVGNPNAGKTTLFNTLTGLRQHVANYPGTTVSLAEGVISIGGVKHLLIDAPGTYSLTPFADDEAVTREILADCSHAAVVVVVDPAHLVRSLSFATELAARGLPLAVFVNVARDQFIDQAVIATIESALGVPAVIADASGAGAKTAFAALAVRAAPSVTNFSTLTSASARLHFAKTTFSRFAFDAHTRSRGIDRFVLHPILGLPIFFAVMWAVFQTTFTLGAYPADLLDGLIVSLIAWVKTTFGDGFIAGILADGILGGVGATIVFIPQIAILFALVAVLEQSGYLARAAYVLENVMRRIGLHGRSAVPMLMGFGCNVPAIMAIRTLPTHREKVITAMMLPFMSCSARLPVLVLLVGAFVPAAWAGTTLFALYAGGIVAAIVTAFLLKHGVKGVARPLLLELPAYRLPNLKTLALVAWGAVKHFLRRAGKILLPLAVVLWVLFSYPAGAPIEDTYAARVGHTIAPIFSPLGFDWRATTGLIAGIAAKEVYVATVGTLYALADTEDTTALAARLQADATLDPATIAALLVFIVLYTPCIAVIATLKSELGWRWALFGAVYPTVFAWFAALATRHIFLAFVTL